MANLLNLPVPEELAAFPGAQKSDFVYTGTTSAPVVYV